MKLGLKKKGGGPPFWSWWEGRILEPGRYRLEVLLGRKTIESEVVPVESGRPALPETADRIQARGPSGR